MIEILINEPWPWYVAGPMIGLVVPLLLILGNKSFGISSSMRHICAACMPADIPFFKYNWKKEIWNLYFVLGIYLGALFTSHFIMPDKGIEVSAELRAELAQYGITSYENMIPNQLVGFDQLFSLRGFLMMVVGGFLVGFGTRYAGGCTSGHSIMGLSTLQWPSLIATCCFMTGGFLSANVILPFILKL